MTEKPKRIQVLLADDQPRELTGLHDFVDWEAFDMEVVYMATSAADALNYLASGKQSIEEKAIQSNSIDFIITDIMMPDMDGFEFVERIRNQIPTIKVIFVSCFDEFSFVQKAISMDASAYLLKPVLAGDLSSALSKVRASILEEKQIREQLYEIDKSSSFKRKRVLEHEVALDFCQTVDRSEMASRLLSNVENPESDRLTMELIICSLLSYIEKQDDTDLMKDSWLKDLFDIVFVEELSDSSEYISRITKIFRMIDDSFSAKHQQAVDQIIANINKHQYRDISEEELFEGVFYSRNYMNSIFKEYTGQSLYQYMKVQRLQAARELLLKDTAVPVYQLAEQYGFSDASHFIKAFRKEFGQTPGDLRKGRESIEQDQPSSISTDTGNLGDY